MTDEEYLAHIESAILQIQAHTAGMTQEAYEAHSKTQRAVERNLQIIGDAAHKLSAKLRQAHPRLRGMTCMPPGTWSSTTTST